MQKYVLHLVFVSAILSCALQAMDTNEQFLANERVDARIRQEAAKAALERNKKFWVTGVVTSAVLGLAKGVYNAYFQVPLVDDVVKGNVGLCAFCLYQYNETVDQLTAQENEGTRTLALLNRMEEQLKKQK